jgi:LPXTG-motif cell wall-anchored protein
VVATLGVLISRAIADDVEAAAAWADGFAIVLVVAGIAFLSIGGLLLLRRRRDGR